MTESARPVVCILVDAFRHDYLDSERAPFLARLARDQASARLRPILGYSDAIRATIFTGRYPDEHGYWMEYCHRPESSPFVGLERLTVVDRIPSDFVRRGVKFILSQTVVRGIARRRGYAHLSLRHLPLRSVGAFDWTLREPMTAPGVFPVPTMFDRLSKAGLRWEYLDASKLGRRRTLRAAASVSPETRFVFVYLHQIDMASHVFGIGGRAFWRVVRRTDRLVEEIVAALRGRLGDVDLIVFSDHGMSSIRRLVDYRELRREQRFPGEFVFALDATMVRLWNANDEVRDIVMRGAPGRFLNRGELAELHLDFSEPLYGEEIYLLEPGVAIFPNFHSMLKPKAMHAYHPDDPDQQGIYVAPAHVELGDTVELTRTSEDVLRLCGVAA